MSQTGLEQGIEARAVPSRRFEARMLLVIAGPLIAAYLAEYAMVLTTKAIVGRLETGDVELEESIVIYERGEALREHCDKLLKQAEARVEKLTLSGEGSPTGTQALND